HEHIARIPAIEILLNNVAARKYILEAREGELLDVIRNNHEAGMIDFTSSLVKLVEEEYIHYRVAMDATPNPEELSMRLKGIK
ncbi:MAG: twitching motility protein PilT, partial [Planctomycetota bacterium]